MWEWKEIQKMPRKIVEEIKKLVRKTCFAKTNFFGPNAWCHISSVVKYSKLLAKRLGADREIVELAAWLHDYASILKKEWYLDHHIHGTRLAENVLKKFNYPKNKVEKVKHCIFAHRASKKIPRKTLEAKILASADAMAHFDRVDTLLYLTFVTYKMDLDQGERWVLDKLARSWKKLLPEGKAIIKEKYQAIKLVFNSKISEV